MILDEKFLLDDWSVKGNDYQKFQAAIKEVQQHTLFNKGYIKDFIPAILDREYTSWDENQMSLRMYSGEGKKDGDAILKRSDISKAGRDQDFLEEFESFGLTLILDRGDGSYTPYFSSKGLMRTLGQRIKFSDKDFKPCKEIGPLLGKKFDMYAAQAVVFVNVFYEDKSKIKAVHTGKHITRSTAPDFDAIVRYYGGFVGKMTCQEWYIDHDYYVLQINFPELGEVFSQEYGLPDLLVPGIRLITSDTGQYGFEISHTLRPAGKDMGKEIRL